MFVAAEEAAGIDQGVRIAPVRQEQLKERLGECFRELDMPLLLEWPDGRRQAMLFVLVEESDPRRFSVHRLAPLLPRSGGYVRVNRPRRIDNRRLIKGRIARIAVHHFSVGP